MDAGQEREKLAQGLADWMVAGFISPQAADRFGRSVRRLAKQIDMTTEEVWRDLREDAQNIIDAGEER